MVAQSRMVAVEVLGRVQMLNIFEASAKEDLLVGYEVRGREESIVTPPNLGLIN